MKLKYEMEKGFRTNRYFWKAYTPKGYLFNYDLKIFEKYDDCDWNKYDYSNVTYPIRTVRAFRRRLKQWSSQLPKGTKICLRSDLVGYDVYGYIK